MFQKRTSPQKPSDEFIANFHQSFPWDTTPGEVIAGDPLIESLDLEALSPTPQQQHELFTTSLLDPSSFAFSNFANQLPEYNSPGSSITKTLYHDQAGDLYKDNPLGQLHPQQHQRTQQPQQPPQSSYAPLPSVHQFDRLVEHVESPQGDDCHTGSWCPPMQNQIPKTTSQPLLVDMGSINTPLLAPTRNFRFQVTLDAATAMVKQKDELPITYLNRRQVYSISVVDTAPPLWQLPETRYRTSIWISFENKQPRVSPGTYWQLWRDGRGTNEAHQRGCKLRAVEYITANQPGESDDERTCVELDTSSVDRFSIIWTPGVYGMNSCRISVRFNFLSTDFSRSKGVQGIPVHLCAKTTICPKGLPQSLADLSEVVFCKVKLFRDHGSERKLSNDIVRVKKTIGKLKQQILLAETSMKDFSKVDRADSSRAPAAKSSQQPSKARRYKRTWSTSPAPSAGGQVPVQDDLYNQLQTMQDMLDSTRPISILSPRAEEDAPDDPDDPDHPDHPPVVVAREPLGFVNTCPRGSRIRPQRSDGSSTTRTSSLVSLLPNSISQAVNVSAQQSPSALAILPSVAPTEMQSLSPPQLTVPPDQLTKEQTRGETRRLSGWIEVLGVNRINDPLTERLTKPIACFYILYRGPTKAEESEQHYRAVYLMQRTLEGFINGIAATWYINPTKVLRTLHILDRGLYVEMDDDVVRELSEGQDIIMDIARAQNPVKPEWEMSVDVTVDTDNYCGAENVAHNEGYELHLRF